jgi:hypothetical protein
MAEKPISREDFMLAIEKIFDRGYQIIKAKNNDYAGEVTDDQFRNFRSAPIVGVPVARGILVRIMDKITRISNLLDQEAAVADEKIDDTLIDAINYLAILLVYLKLQREEE